LLQWGNAVLHNGLFRYQDALALTLRAGEDPHESAFSTWAVAELIEAMAAAGCPSRQPLRLSGSDSIRASGMDWWLGIEARSRALLSNGQTAERLARTRMTIHLARAHLLFGEWLRRENRRADARGKLRTAHQMLAAMGAGGFAERAARERSATGERARRRSADTPARLTARENQIAWLVGDGVSNPEIAARLFMSPRTVEYHLHKVFTKLAISSRNQLRVVLVHHRNEGPGQAS
jgi:DNA-binding CsgD family transcriptional regulator